MLTSLREYRVIPTVKDPLSEDEAKFLAEALSEGGLPIMELSFRQHSDVLAMKAVQKEFPDFCLGVSGILNKDLLLRVVDVNASYATAPGVNIETIEESKKHQILFIPGACTPSDIETILLKDLRGFQFFPAEQSGGSEMLKAIIGPFEHLKLTILAKGGITSHKLKQYFDIPEIVAVSPDNCITRVDYIKNKQWKKVTKEAQKATASLGFSK